MKSDDPESDKVVSINQVKPLVTQKVPRVVTSIPEKNGHRRGDKRVVAKATDHTQGGIKEIRKSRTLISDLVADGKRGKRKRRRGATSSYGPSVDISRARASCDVVRLAIKELGWREV